VVTLLVVIDVVEIASLWLTRLRTATGVQD
jgi:hypothetical protein